MLRNKFFNLFFIIAIEWTDCELVYIKNDANNSLNKESRDGPRISSYEGVGDKLKKEKKIYQMRIHILLTNYQPIQIHKIIVF